MCRSRDLLTGSPKALQKREARGPVKHLIRFIRTADPFYELWLEARAAELAQAGANRAAARRQALTHQQLQGQPQASGVLAGAHAG